ncbi:hypothetical protein MKW94_016280 [Papaver nudicaule]|uniref:Phytocyanin domain-containing protein n=1 Tax=Papaver nudicaule TaxID=74823 RepID=A0AA41SNE6_PAPNU|nr:hypothetical protein [Papaver nudicaule]
MEFRSCILFVMLMGFVYSSEAANKYVGGTDGWVATPAMSLNQWAEKTRFSVNDSLGMESVLVVNSEDYYTCNTKNPIQTLDGGDSSFKLEKSGPFYFIGDKDGNCAQVQKNDFVIPPKSSPSPSPAPVAKPPKSSSPSPAQIVNPPKAASPSPAPVANPPMLASPSPAPIANPPMSASPSPAPVAKYSSPSPTPSATPPKSASPSPSLMPYPPTPVSTPPTSSPPMADEAPEPSGSKAYTGAPAPAPSSDPSSLITYSSSIALFYRPCFTYSSSIGFVLSTLFLSV